MKPLTLVACLAAAFFSSTALTQEAPGPEAAALLRRVEALDQKGNVEEALKLLDEGLEKYRELNYDRFFTLNYKFIVLSRMNRLEAAVKVAEEKAGIIKSPRQALIVADSYLKLKDTERALVWISESVDRGLQSYTTFNSVIYEPLHGNRRFVALVETVKKRNGLGLAAPSFKRDSLSGGQVALEDYRGKVVLLDFWATFCSPCLEQLPHLKQVYEKYRERGFEILGFSEDQDRDRLGAFVKENGMGWKNVFCPEGESDPTVRLYKVINIPASFLVDRNGIVRHVNLTGRDLERAIEELLGQRRTPPGSGH